MGHRRKAVLFLISHGVTLFGSSLVQFAAPAMQGRMFGLFGAMHSGFLPLGMAVFGPLSDAVSMRLLMVVSGLLLILLAASVLRKSFYLHGRPQADADADKA